MTLDPALNPALDPRVIDSLRQLTQDGEPDVLAEVLGLFLADAPARLAAIAAAAQAGDGPALHRSAHALKGAAGTIGASALQAGLPRPRGDRTDGRTGPFRRGARGRPA